MERSRNNYNSYMETKIKTLKAEMRKLLKNRISANTLVPSNYEKTRDETHKACTKFLESTLYENASLVFCFISTKDEISTNQIIVKALEDGKKVAVPKVIFASNKMEFYYLQNISLEEQTEVGSFNILEPKSDLEKVQFSKIKEQAVIICPGLGFDKKGYRLGKGKGFYDCFFDRLKKENPSFWQKFIKIGICYLVQIMEKIPAEQNDVKMDFLLTSEEIVKCN